MKHFSVLLTLLSTILNMQIAYGIECEVDVCPYKEDAMTLMDYRTNYVDSPTAEVGSQHRERHWHEMSLPATRLGSMRILLMLSPVLLPYNTTCLPLSLYVPGLHLSRAHLHVRHAHGRHTRREKA